MTEVEPKRYRNGESGAKPWGGYVADKPFPKALHGLALSRGFEFRSTFGRALGFSHTTVSKWIRGERAPSPESFGKILELLNPGGEGLDELVDSYGQLLAEGFGRPAVRGSDEALRIGQRGRREAETKFDTWVFDFCDRRHIRLRDFFEPIGVDVSDRQLISLTTFSAILERAGEIHNLDQQDIDTLAEAIAVTIQNKIEGGHTFKGSTSTSRVQKELACTTYNGAQAGAELGVSRERVRVLRKRYGLPLLLTDSNLKMIREKAEATRNSKIRKVG